MHRRINNALRLGTLLILVLISLMQAMPVLAASSSYEVRLSTTTPIVNSGEWAVIKVDYSCSAVFNVACSDAVISSVIPPELARAIGDVQALDPSNKTTTAYDEATSTATWTFNADIAPGDAGTFTLMVRFAKGSTPDGAIAILRAEMSGSSAPPVISKPLPITAVAQPSARATKRFVSGGVLDLPTVYQVQVCVPSSIGAVDITSVVMTDTLPLGSTFVSATDGGTHNAGTVTWPAASILVSAGQSCLTHTVTVQFPTGAFNIGDEIRNDLAADVTFLGGATMSLSGFDVRLIQPPTPNPGFGKSGPANAEVGDTVTYSFSSSNSGTSPLDSHVFTDTIPVELEVTRIIAAAHNLTNTLNLRIEYQTNLNATWTSIPGSPFTGAGCVNIAPNTGGGCTSFDPGGRITALRYTYLDQLPYGFAVSGNGFMAKVISAPVNQIIVNTADAEFSFNGHKILRQSTARTRVVVYTPGARPSVAKAVNPGIVNAGDTVTYTLTLKNNSFQSLTTPLVNPQIVDLLMSDLLYVDGSQQITAKPPGAPDPVFDIVPNYSGGKPLLRWRWIDTSAYNLAPGETITIQFQARIAPYTASGSLSNTGYLSGWDNQPSDILMDSCSSSSADLLDYDNDGNTQEQICSSTISSVTLAAAANSGSLKEVLGQLDTVWTHDPDHGYTVPGGSADYQLTITNTGTIPISELTLLDILPWVGDVGVKQSTTPRGTEWRPFLVEPITVPSGASVFYSTQNNPCRVPDLGIDPDNESPGCDAPIWSSAPPTDITTVQSFKINFGGLVLQPDDSVTVTVHMRAPYTETVTAGKIAWNSFGYRARAVGAAEFLLAPEPPRVGIEREQPKPPAYGNYVWLDQNKDGLQTAGETGVNGARIELFHDNDGTPGQSAGDTLVDTTISGPDDAGNPGYYLFSSYPSADPRYASIMPPGDYYARITPPLGYGVTTKDVGGDDAIDSDIDPATGYTPVTNLIDGEIDTTWDAGLTTSTAVGNYVWIDRNANGIQDESADDGVNGVTVNLYTAGDTFVATTFTANDPFGLPGYYLFDKLTPGDYYVEFIKPAGFTGFTTQGSGTNPQDSDANPATGKTSTFTLLANQYDPTRDAGLTLPSDTLTLGNLVWRDLNNNGRYDPADGEYGIDGVRLTLSTSAGTNLRSTTTSTHLGEPGWYQFSNLVAGDYIVTIDASNFAPGGALYGLRTSTGNEPTPDPDSNIDNDDNGDASSGQIVSQAITLSAGGEPSALIDGDGSNGNQTLDFGMIGGASLGNFVWFDTNGDGIQDSGEPAVPGVTVELLDAGGAVLKTTTTDSTGRYGFSELSAGDYRVRFSNLPAGNSFTGRNLGGNAQLDSDADPTPGPTIGETTLITLADGDADLSWDAGLVATLASIGDRAWDDQNRDGVQDALEPGINGVTAKLYRADGTLVGTTTTANVLGIDGIYGFSGLPPGDYYVVFSTIPSGYTVSPQNIGTDDTKDSDADTATRRTATTTLDPGENDPSWDIGLFGYASIGDFVWNDKNRDGVQDVGEPGVSGVAVRLYRQGESTPVASTTTDSSGYYHFTNLVPDLNYYLEFSMPAGYSTTVRDAGGNTPASDLIDSDPDLSTYQTIPTPLIIGENDTSWDFGIYPTASIGDKAWLDLNANGIQDVGESNGVAGVQVILHNASGSEIDSTVTNTSGNYSFSGLAPGDYWLSFVLPDTYLLSPQDQGGDDAKDSDVAPGTLRTIQTTLDIGEIDMSWDVGVYQPSKLGDRVWHDLNANGVQDPGELGVSGVAVALLDSAGNPVDGDPLTTGIQAITTTTTISGTYLFSDLAPGDYIVEFAMPTGYTKVSPKNSAAADSDNDSDVVSATMRTPLISLPSSTSDLSWDMGVYNLAALGDRVWLDTNVNGIQDDGATGVNGVTVTLYSSAGITVTSTTTDATGIYTFTNLTPGNYYLIFSDLPADHSFTQQNQGSDDTLDSDANPISGVTGLIGLASGQTDKTWDAGIFPKIDLGDRVWIDLNANGIQDPNEDWIDANNNSVQDPGELNGVPGVKVELYQGASLVDYTYTDLDGNYLFEDLFPGTYRIVFSNIPAGYLRSPQDQGGDDAKDSDADASFTITDFTISASDMTRDMGLYKPASLGDYVWHDQNANGVQDAGEPGIDGATVTLQYAGPDGVFGTADDNLSAATTTTAGGGAYSFTGLTPGFYRVQFALPAGFDKASAANQGADDTVDSDADPTTLRTTVTELTSGENDPTWDAGFYQFASLGDLVWEDMNGNGVQDSGEPGINGVGVALDGTDGAGNVVSLTTTTDSNGAYSFTGLTPGSYHVTFTPPAGYEITLKDLASGATADEIDSDADRTTGATIDTTLVSGEDDPTWDAGLYRPATIGDRVWEDINGDGVQEAGSPTFPSVTVTLQYAGPDGTFGTADDNLTAATTTTDASGNYLFTGRIPGTYKVTFDRPSGYAFTQGDVSGNTLDSTDSDVATGTAATRTTIATALVSNEDDRTWDAGLYQLLSLGNRVWDDLNNDGLLNNGEAGIDGVTVRLYRDSNGNGTIDAGAESTAVATTTTSNGGAYLFSGLTQGKYLVEIVAPAGYISSTGINGSASGPYEPASPSAVDSDDNGTTSGAVIRSAVLDLLPNATPLAEADTTMPTATTNPARDENSDLTLDFGLFKPAQLGNFVWFDRDANGVQNGGDETGIISVTVTLLDGSGAQVDGDPITIGTQAITTTTNASGIYAFTNIISGTYRVGFDLPTGYEFSPIGKGTATTDSDADPATGKTAALTLTAGQSDQTWDTGLYQRVRLGNQVWDDLNNDGEFDSGTESGIVGVTVELRGTNGLGDTVTLTTTTAISGTYLFDNLIPGTYVVTLPASNFSGAGKLAASGNLPAYVSSTGTVGSATGPYEGAALADPDNNIDNNDSGTTDGSGNVASLPITLRSQDEPALAADTDDTNGNLTVDFGVFRPLSLGDLVWNDTDNDGLFNNGEVGIDGVTVELYRDTDGNNAYTAGTDTFVVSDTTKLGGLYLFDKLIPGDYVVVIPASNFTGTGALRYFRSSDGGVLPDSANDPDDNVNDDDNGVGPSAGVATGSVSSGAVTLKLDDEPINDGDTNSNSNLSVDFGFYSLGLGNLVWSDANNDGLKDTAEVGLDDLTVSLYYDADDSGTIEPAEAAAATTITTSNGGHYFFGGLRDGGHYQIRVGTGGPDWVSSTGGANGMPTGTYEPGTTVTGNASDIDNDDNGTQVAGNTVTSTIFSVTLGNQPTGETDTGMPSGATNRATDESTNLSVDFGLFNHARMGDWVWIDTNGNGVQDGGETNGVGGVTVKLYQGATLISTTTTLASGFYGFSYLNTGTYSVTFDLSTIPAHYGISPQNSGADDAKDSDADEATGTTATFTLAAGDNDTSWDMGIYPLLSLGNLIWDDLNDSGTVDAGEPGFDGVTVELYRDTDNSGSYDVLTDTLVLTTTTDTSGNYLFTDLQQGDYLVVIPASNFASGKPLYLYRSSTGSNGAATHAYEPAPDPDTGLDGVIGGGDDDADNDDNGTDDPAGYAVTKAISLNPSYEPINDGDTDPNTNLTLDLGFFQHLSLGNLVWDDVNNNGLFDVGENGINGVTVDLYLDNGDGSYGAGDTFVVSDTTKLGGIYSFTNLIPGDYIAVIPASNFTGAGALAASGGLSAYTSSTGTNGSAGGDYEPAPDPDTGLDGAVGGGDDDANSDDNGSLLGSGDIATRAITLASGTEPASGVDGDGTNGNQTLDFGLFRPASIGDFVWEDSNGNGVQDAGEPGIDGVTVTLYQGATPISTTTTLPSGFYQFTDLIPNDYSVTVTAPAGYVFTAQDQGADDTADSDADSSGVMISTTLIAGESDMTWDAGLYKPVSVGNQVWYDTNNNRNVDPGEVGINGVRVELFFDANDNGTIEDNSGSGGVDETQAVAVTTTTTAAGTYLFTERTNASGTGLSPQRLLNPGTYVVGIPASELDPTTGALRGLFSSGTTMGADGTTSEIAPADPDTGGATAPDGDDNGALQASGFYSGGVLALPVTLSPGTEPVGENPDVDPNPAVRPDANDNQTVDFGFYTASLGNLVWDDLNNDGAWVAGELGIANVTVRLYSSNGNEIPIGPDGRLGTADDALGGMTTNSSGNYAFSRLPEGSYQVQIDVPAGYVSTRDTADSANPSANTDNDDNGVGSDQTATTATSNVFTLVPGAEPTVNNATGSSDDPTIDFGIVRYYSLGNRVWDDRNNNGTQNAGENGISGVTVRLLQSDGVNPAVRIDGSNAPVQTSDASGFYRFDLLPAGDYIVEVIASNFTGANALAGYRSSTSSGSPLPYEPAPDPDSDATDEDDNGTVSGAVVRSAAVTLGEGTGTAEPTSEIGGGPAVTTGEAPDAQSNRTVDFGFYPSFSLGNRVWNDLDNSGTINAADGASPGIAGVAVRLLDSAGNPATDATGATVADQTTTADGYYLFTDLFAGDYIVEVVPPAGYRSSTGNFSAYEPAPDPDTVATDDAQR
ncbi:carboxypeptidase regulatory-like domain-containing protein [Oscillochloris sp. ZM17-4]|uniref:SdrD B-like domain-containing protein n=1 Tax=Oscillochloris sp. ZM17-4 TaxID=2866714 RepID=UPI001C73D9D8|nr:SdrD B-like domain-containing protein [Oscillochloris sp. ZM17-4]MBX0326164.1 carboxypeptidase regulatory-like domain-containing protein [Oscillochloris sp. ZM17-4]